MLKFADEVKVYERLIEEHRYLNSELAQARG